MMGKRLHDWESLIAELEVSDLSRAAFCRQRKLKYQTMSNWILRRSQSPVSSKRATADKSRNDRQAERRRSANASAKSSTSALAKSSTSGLANEPATVSPRFVEVPIQLGATTQSYEIVLGTGRSIRVPAAFDADTVARLIQAVESC